MINSFKTLLVVLWLMASVGLYSQIDHLIIDTNLSDVAPRTLGSKISRDATDTLRNNIESRVILLLTGDDEFALEEAEVLLRKELSGSSELALQATTDQIFVSLKNQLEPFRFNFVSTSQRQSLLNLTAEQIANQSQQSLYSTVTTPRLFSFDKDPLGWHSQALLDLFTPESVNENQRLVAFTIRDGALDMRAQAELSNKINLLSKTLQQSYNVRLDTSGVFFFAAEAAANAKRDITFISSISTLGVVLLLGLTFGNLRALTLPVLSVVSGVTFAATVTHLVFGSLHILTIVFGASLIGIAIDYALHYLVHQSSELVDSGSVSKQTSKRLLGALGLSLCTSMVGYAALGFAGLAALQKVALFSCCGLLMAWLTVVALGSWFTATNAVRTQVNVLTRLADFLRRSLQAIPTLAWSIAVIICVVVAAIQSSDSEYFSDDPRVFFNVNPELLASEQRVAVVANDYEPGRYIVIAGDNTQQVYDRVALFFDRVTTQGEYQQSDFTGIPTWLPSSEAQQKNYKSLATLYSQGGAAGLLSIKLTGGTQAVEATKSTYQHSKDLRLLPEQLLTILDQALPPAWFSNDAGEVIAFLLIKKGLNTDQIVPITNDLSGVEYVNTLARTQQALAKQRSAASRYLVVAAVLIGLILLLRYRSLGSLRQLLVPVGSIAGFLVICPILGVQVNLFHVMALFLVLGFGMDYAIFSHEMVADFNVALQAIVLSALTSLLSFGLLALSDIPVVSSFGLTLLIGNTLNLIGAIVLAQNTRPRLP